MITIPGRPLATLLALALLVGCSDRKPAPVELPDLGATLPNLLMPANAGFVSSSGSRDALSIVLRAPGQPEAVVRFYRSFLNPPVWRVISDTKDAEGAHVIYAEQNGPPLWIRVWADSVNNGTFIRLTGAVQKLARDTTRAAAETGAGGR
jgi:hypothetical protein